MSRGPMTTCRMQVWSANTKLAGVPGGARLATASSTAVPGSVIHWMGAFGAFRSGSTKAVQAPAFAAGARPCHPPDALARGEAASFAVMGSAKAIIALIMGIAAQTLPGDLLVVQRQDVVVGAGGRWPGLTEKRNCRCHDSSDAFGPGPLAGCSDASGCIRCLRGGGTVEAGRAYDLRGRTSRLFPSLRDVRCTIVNVRRRLTRYSAT